MAALAQDRAEEAARDTLPLHPRRALAEIRAALPKDAIVTLGTGNTCLQAADRLAHYQAPALVTPLDFGLVGFGMPAAIGVKAAGPDGPVIAIMGDGSMGFTMIEVQTAVSHKLPVIFIVLDNQAWGACSVGQLSQILRTRQNLGRSRLRISSDSSEKTRDLLVHHPAHLGERDRPIIDPEGDLAGILAVATGNDKSAVSGGLSDINPDECEAKVAGARNSRSCD